LVGVPSNGPFGSAGVAKEADERRRTRDGHRRVSFIPVA
jgi:hypothetical protein